MRPVTTLALTAALLIGVAGLGAAQPKSDAGRATDAQGERSSPKQVCGKVTEVDGKARTFTISARGKPMTLDAAQVKTLPKVGDTVDVTYSPSDGPSKGASLRGNTIKIVWQEGKK
jgi:hypothetical protein